MASDLSLADTYNIQPLSAIGRVSGSNPEHARQRKNSCAWENVKGRGNVGKYRRRIELTWVIVRGLEQPRRRPATSRGSSPRGHTLPPSQPRLTQQQGSCVSSCVLTPFHLDSPA